jgi:hypothetical protein
MRMDDLDEERLITALRSAGRGIPGAGSDLGADVVRRLRSAPPRAGHARRGAVAAAVAACMLLAAAAINVLVPGVNLRFDPMAEPAPDTPLAVDAEFLGTPVTLTEARERAGFPVRVPALPGLARPQVHVSGRDQDARVSLLYPPTRDMPAMTGTPVGLFVTQFLGDVDPDLLTKVAGDAEVTAVELDGGRGWWIEGVHEVVVMAPDGTVTAEPSRFADNTLLWSRDGVTLRLESAAPLDRAINVATSMHERERAHSPKSAGPPPTDRRVGDAPRSAAHATWDRHHGVARR